MESLFEGIFGVEPRRTGVKRAVQQIFSSPGRHKARVEGGQKAEKTKEIFLDEIHCSSQLGSFAIL
jgi:hypothetical protein